MATQAEYDIWIEQGLGFFNEDEEWCWSIGCVGLTATQIEEAEHAADSPNPNSVM